MDNRHFQGRRMGGSGCYTCCDCKKLTRETGQGESSLEMCRRCYDLSGAYNSFQDGNCTAEEFKAGMGITVEEYEEGKH